MQVSSKEAKDRFGEIMAASGHDTVMITRYGRPERALISAERLEELESIEDRYWLALARKGEESGFLGPEASEALIKEMLSAED